MAALPAELQSLGHRPNFFYLQHAMGLASSTGLGLALSLPHQKIVVLDGDGSLLMNLGSLSTLARYKPKNLVHIVFDNESLLSVGGFPTATSTGTDLEGIARAAGIPQTCTVRTVDDFAAAARRELSRYDARGPAWYWNAFETGEHTGTHFDAPVHWVSGKDLPDSTVDRIAPRKFIGPACVIDVTKEVAANADFLLTSAHILQWESAH